jgi:hypothetical protein
MSFIGIDVATATLGYACRPSGEADSVPNDDQGIRALVERLPAHEPTLIVLEATGGYEAAKCNGQRGNRTPDTRIFRASATAPSMIVGNC